MERTKNIYPASVPWLEKEKPLALATILETSGSTPQVPGASALFSRRGLLLGTLGGGSLEADAQKKALRCLRSGRSLIYEFKLRGEEIEGEEALCGGSALILIDSSPRNHLETFRKLRQSLRSRRAGLLLTQIESGRGREVQIQRFWLKEEKNLRGAARRAALLDPRGFERTWRDGRLRLVLSKKKRTAGSGKKGEERRIEKGKGKMLFLLELLSPLPRLLIAGAGHVGQAVARLGHRLDFEVTVIDDRAEFANQKRLPEADMITVGDIGRSVAAFPIGSDTYVVIVTRGHRDDAAALRACIQSSAAYVGMIGSRRKIALMRKEFSAKKWATAEKFDRVHAPIGLPIGSKTVEEIAVSVAAELVRVRSGIAGGKAGRVG